MGRLFLFACFITPYPIANPPGLILLAGNVWLPHLRGYSRVSNCLISNNNISAVKVNKVLDEFGLDLGNLPDMVGVELRMGQILAERAFSEVSHTQVSPGLFMILALVRNNPGQKQTTLAGSVRLDRSTMVSIMDHCERQGWVERKPYAGDRRAHSIIITRKGEQLVQKLEQDVLLLEKKIAARMGQSERDQLLRLLKKFHTAVID